MRLHRPIFLLALLTAVPLIAADSPNALTDAEKAAGWKLIFDGASTAGWLGIGGKPFPATGWSVEAGTLKHTKGGGDIVTADAYENFELSWDWKIAKGGNSGVKYNLPNPMKNVGFEYQLIDDENAPDAAARGGRRSTAGLYDLFQASAGKPNAPGEWNTSRIVVAGKKVEHWLNGVKTVEFELGSEALKTAIAGSKYAKIAKFGEKVRSPILLQDHGDEIAFRAIKLRVL